MRTRTNFFLIVLILYALAVPAYIAVRFAGRWLDVDAARLTAISQGVFEEATLTPSSGAYWLGFAYPSLNTFLARLGGVSAQTVQRSIQPFLLVLVIPVAFAAFRALAEDESVALLATLFLCLQPEFMFEAVRSSHAKVTYALALCALFALGRSLRRSPHTWSLVRWVALFYLFAFGLITNNAFFASSYIFGIAFAFWGGQAIERFSAARDPESASRLRRLLYTALSCSLLLFLFLFYLYPPAMHQIRVLRSIVDRIAAFLFDLEMRVNPYGYVGSVWPSLAAYVLLTLFNWLVLLSSFGVWLHQTWTLLVRREQALSVPLLLWLLYAAFAALLAVSVPLDVAGVLSANLQVRLFPHLMITAIPLSALGLVRFLRQAFRRGRGTRRAAAVTMVVCVLVFAAASLIKITNDPLLSRRWKFQSAGEDVAVQWVTQQVRAADVWVGVDNRMDALAKTDYDWDRAQLRSDWGEVGSSTRYFLISDILRMWAAQADVALPKTEGHLRIYDNGRVQLYHARPKTPYQR